MLRNLLFLWLFVGFTVETSGLECGKCMRSSCAEVGFCINGKTLDLCGCCDVCARRLGQPCDPPDVQFPVKKHGKCGEFLTCRKQSSRGDTSEEYTCACEDESAVCGSDAVTYLTLCVLLEKMADNRTLNVFDRAPCRKGPVIQSVIKEMTRPKGSILIMDCEAIGYPVPTVSWQLYKKDGSTLELPSDNPSIAVQVRGGPEKNMVTGWVQIVELSEENEGIYTCIAKNAEGETKQSGKVSLTTEKDLKTNTEN